MSADTTQSLTDKLKAKLDQLEPHLMSQVPDERAKTCLTQALSPTQRSL